MTTINNEILGQFKQAKPKKSLHPFFWVSGSILSFVPFVFGIFLRAISIYFIWNLFLGRFPIPTIEFKEAFALTSFLYIATIRYHGMDMMESFVDLFVKTVLVALSCIFIYNFF